MESLRSALNAMRKDCYFASVDLSDAYYSIRIREQDRKFFRFIFNGIKYQFTALVMGYSCSPRIWTKLMKPVFAYLRSLGHISVYFIDDSCLFGETYQTCLRNVQDTVHLMDNLGLTLNQKKSVLVPCKRITFLGFIMCSESMTVRITSEKCNDIIVLCNFFLNAKRTTIRNFAKLIGKLNAAEPGVQHATLFIKPMEKIKEVELRRHCGNFDSYMNIPRVIDDILNWWIDNIGSSFKHVTQNPPHITIYTDASLQMYGAYDETNDSRTQGFWSTEEQRLHINILEMKACEIGIHTFCRNSTNVHVRLYTDNTTSCSYINNYGGKISNLDEIARRLWFWCIERHIHISAYHMAGVTNKQADKLSRSGNDDLEWALDANVFASLKQIYPDMQVDLFASRLNTKLPSYVSRYPEPEAWAIDAFSFTWCNQLFYIFPPFSLIPRILQKIEEEGTQALLIAPIWPTQAWWPNLIKLITDNCYLLPKTSNVLKLMHKPNLKHPLTKMRLAGFRISGQPYESKAFREQLKTSFSNPGVQVHRNNTTRILTDGYISVKGKEILLKPLHKL